MLRVTILLVALSAGAASPARSEHPEYARWMVETYHWGVMSSTSTLEGMEGVAFGNPQSHTEIDGTPYFYVSDMDQTMKDIAANPKVSYTLSSAESATDATCAIPVSATPLACKPPHAYVRRGRILCAGARRRACPPRFLVDLCSLSCSSHHLQTGGDPESPLCSRLNMVGTFTNVSGTSEGDTAQAALFAAHPSMTNWPASHGFFVGKLSIDSLWLINMYGGAAIIDTAEYHAAGNASAVAI